MDLQCWLTKPKFRPYIKKKRQDLKHWKHQEYGICSESLHFFSPIHSCKLSIHQGSHETVKVIFFHLWTGLLPWISHCISGRTRKPKLTEKWMEPLSNKKPWKTRRGGSHLWSQYLGGGGAGIRGQCLLHRKLQDKRKRRGERKIRREKERETKKLKMEIKAWSKICGGPTQGPKSHEATVWLEMVAISIGLFRGQWVLQRHQSKSS